MAKNKKVHKTKQCCFCGLTEDDEIKYGKIHECDDVSTHYYCLLLSSNMEQRGNDDEGILGFLTVDIHKEIRRGKKLTCSYCKKNGATLGCCNSKCKKIFHFPCGLENGALNQFFGQFRSYCITHRPMQKIDPYIKAEIKNSNEVLCYICYDKVNPEDSITTLWAPCCKKNAWFHKKCVQQLALSAGYFFKCPLCNNNNQFQKAMKEHGIYVPSQDASWELEPNAFQELLHRHNQCDAQVCLCPKGRKYTSTNAKWELTLCRTCGSQGIHTACGELKWGNPLWDCKECSSILSRSKRKSYEGHNHIMNSGSSTSDSDSDISVGMELPDLSNVPSSLPIRLRPGPMCYKLRQIVSHNINSITKPKEMESSDRNGSVDINEQSIPRCSSESMLRSVLLTEDKFTDCKKETNTESAQSLSTSKSDIITIDSEDEIIEITQKNSRSLHSVNLNSNTGHTVVKMDHSELLQSYQSEKLNNRQCAKIQEESNDLDDLSTIKITNVTSWSHEMFTSVPDENSKSSWSSDDYAYNNRITAENDNVVDLSLKRKPDDSPSTQSRITFKRAKSDEFNTSEIRNEVASFSTNIESLPLTSTSASETFFPHNNIQVFNQYTEGTSKNCSYNSEIGKFIVAEVLGDNETDTQSLEETICDMNPLIIEEEEEELADTINTENLMMRSSNTITNTGKDLSQVDSGYTLQNASLNNTIGELVNSPKISTTIKTVVDVKSRYNQSFECTGDAGTNPALGPGNSRDNNHGTDLCKTKVFSSTIDGCSRILRSDSPQSATLLEVETDKSFDSSAKNISDCDRTRIIPEVIPLKDLQFRVCNSNSLQLILYDAFLVNIPIKNSYNYESASSVDFHEKYPEAQTNSENLSDHSGNANDSVIDALEFSLVNNKDACKLQPYIHEGIGSSNNDDTKENLNPITAVVNNLSSSSNQHESTEATKVLTSKIPFEQDNRNETNVLPSSTNNMENVSENVSRQHNNSRKDTNNKSSGRLETESTELQATSRLKNKNCKSVNQVTSSTEDHESTDSRLTENVGTDICRFRISIDLYKVRNVIGTNSMIYSKTDINDQRQNGKLSNLPDTRVMRRSVVESSNNHTNCRRKTHHSHQSRNSRSKTSSQRSKERTSRNTSSSERFSSRISLQNIEQSELRWQSEHSEKQHTSTR